MRYRKLTKEQFEELHEDFSRFLATQAINPETWRNLKDTNSKVVETQLEIFSDLVWDDVLSKVSYLEHISPQHMFLFHTSDDKMYVIAIHLDNTVDITTKSGYEWLRNNLFNDHVKLSKGTKPYTGDKKQDIFKLIEEGATITKGDLYLYFDSIIP